MNPYSNHQLRRDPVETPANLGEVISEGSGYVMEKSILETFDFPEMIEDYLIELEIRNYSRNTIKTYKSIVLNFTNFYSLKKTSLMKEEF